jgi:hypothetical protein
MLRVLILIFLLPTTLAAQEAEPPMTLERMARIVEAIDSDANISGSAFELTIDDIPVLVVTDVTADRMRAMVPIRAADALDEAELRRLMQANFDTALDARYAVANGRLWSVFIHPFHPLRRASLSQASPRR